MIIHMIMVVEDVKGDKFVQIAGTHLELVLAEYWDTYAHEQDHGELAVPWSRVDFINLTDQIDINHALYDICETNTIDPMAMYSTYNVGGLDDLGVVVNNDME